jgi:hypothetical protein
MLAGPAWAHVGPPFPIIENRPAGPYVITVWAHPDLGTGTFYVILAPAPGTTLPEENQVEVSVQPLTGRLPEATYPGTRQDDVRDKVQYYAEADFDRQELWRVRVRMSGATGAGEVISKVEPTPTTYGRWDLLIYSIPSSCSGGCGSTPPFGGGDAERPRLRFPFPTVRAKRGPRPRLAMRVALQSSRLRSSRIASDISMR